MSLHIKSINADTSFLLTFAPAGASKFASPAHFPGSFTVLLDPWLEGSTHVYHPKFSQTSRTGTSSIASLAELGYEPDVVACSQDKPDHCNKATLTRLAPDCASYFVSTPAAVKKIRSWNHFDPASCKPLATYTATDPDTVLRISVPSPSQHGEPGEVTVSMLAPAIDISGLHNAIGITYRPPSTPLSQRRSSSNTYLRSPRTSPSSPSSPPPSSRERTLSVLYAPHGIPYAVAKTWAQTHLVRESALPLTALLHNFDEVDNPWFLGGTIAHGLRQGSHIAKYLMPRVWAGVHDEEKQLSGVGIKLMRTRKVGVEEVRRRLREEGVEVEVEQEDGGGDGEEDGEGGSGSVTGLGHSFSKGSSRSGSTATDEGLRSAGRRGKKMKVVVLGVGEEMKVDG